MIQNRSEGGEIGNRIGAIGGEGEMKERRRFMRFNVTVEVEYIVPGNGTPIEGISITRDLSREGMQIAINNKLLPGTELEIKLKIPGSDAPIYAKGSIVWIRKAKEESEAIAGVKITNVSSFDRNRILDHVYKEWVDQQLAKNLQPKNK